jgi:hypothetical protein
MIKLLDFNNPLALIIVNFIDTFEQPGPERIYRLFYFPLPHRSNS